MARMLGRWRSGPVRDCRTMEHLCGRCSRGDETRRRKRQEARETARFIAAEAWRETAVIADPLVTYEGRPAAFFDERDEDE